MTKPTETNEKLLTDEEIGLLDTIIILRKHGAPS